MDGKLQMKNGDEVPLLERVSNDDIVRDQFRWTPNEPVIEARTEVRVTKGVNLPPHSQTWIPVDCDAKGFKLLEPKAAQLSQKGLVLANGLLTFDKASS